MWKNTMLEQLDEIMWFKNWEETELAVRLEILEEKMLLIDRDKTPEVWDMMETYYRCFKEIWDNSMLKKIWFDRFNYISKTLEELKVIPTTLEFYEMIQQKKVERSNKTWEDIGEYKWRIRRILDK